MSDSKYCKIFRNEEENFSINENWNLTIGKWLARRSKQRKSLISRLKKESEEIIIKEKTLRETQKSTNLSETPSIDAVNRFNTKWKFNNKFFLQKKTASKSYISHNKINYRRSHWIWDRECQKTIWNLISIIWYDNKSHISLKAWFQHHFPKLDDSHIHTLIRAQKTLWTTRNQPNKQKVSHHSNHFYFSI